MNDIIINPGHNLIFRFNGNMEVNAKVDAFNALVQNKLNNGDVSPHGRRPVRQAANNPNWNAEQNALFQSIYSAEQLCVMNQNHKDNQISHDASVLLNLFRNDRWPVFDLLAVF
jgi:hypothetical protein